jgi:hypothetical protein
MQEIDNGDLTIENIPFKIQMIKELIEQLKKEREDDFTNEKERNGITKEIQRIQTRLNNYNNKYDWWKSTRDAELLKSYSVEPSASALGESRVVGS